MILTPPAYSENVWPSTTASEYLEAIYQPTVLSQNTPLIVPSQNIPQEMLQTLAWQSAKEAGLSPAETLVFFRIIKAESGFNPNAKNPWSTASGLMQYLDSTFQSQCINKYHLAKDMTQKDDPTIQLKCATQMLSEGGWGHWSASKSNWLISNH